MNELTADQASPEDLADQIMVAVVEDHPLYRAAVARVLGDVADFSVATTAESVAQFAAARLAPGAVVILDLKLRGVGDAAAVMEVVGMGHRVLVVSAHAGQDEVLGAIAAGARGYLTKDVDGTEIIRAVREVAAGNSYVSPTLASFLLNS
jgi:DNA-binding NarL/FixJ family response regulator